jgi:hypothetical protein
MAPFFVVVDSRKSGRLLRFYRLTVRMNAVAISPCSGFA